MSEEKKKYTCKCGKSFDKIKGLTGHQSNCQIYKDFIKQEKESKRLPNGMFKCENPDCNNEHDGSYGSGRFCSDHCRRVYCGKRVNINGNQKCNFNSSKKHNVHKPYGTWKCERCNLIFETRAQLFAHNHEVHPILKRSSWNKGLTKETDARIANAVLKISVGVKKAIAEGRCIITPEKEALRRKKLSNAALKRTTAVVCKRTEPYIKKDGTIVNLDSSYERIVAKILDEHNIDWIRPKPLDWYSNDGIKHHYFPDFYLTKYNLYFDPKNDYCFKVQAEKISYIKKHYLNCIFMTKDQLTWECIKKILESQSSPVTTPHC